MCCPNITGKFGCQVPTNHALYKDGAFGAITFETDGEIRSGDFASKTIYGFNISANRINGI